MPDHCAAPWLRGFASVAGPRGTQQLESAPDTPGSERLVTTMPRSRRDKPLHSGDLLRAWPFGSDRAAATPPRRTALSDVVVAVSWNALHGLAPAPCGFTASRRDYGTKACSA